MIEAAERSDLCVTFQQLESLSRCDIGRETAESLARLRILANENKRRTQIGEALGRWQAGILLDQEQEGRRWLRDKELIVFAGLELYHTATSFKHRAFLRELAMAWAPLAVIAETLRRAYLSAQEIHERAAGLDERHWASRQRRAVEEEEQRYRTELTGEQIMRRGRIATAAQVRLRNVWASILQRHWRSALHRRLLRRLTAALSLEEQLAREAVDDEERHAALTCVDALESAKVMERHRGATMRMQRAWRSCGARQETKTRRRVRNHVMEAMRLAEVVRAATLITAAVRGKQARIENAKRADALRVYLQGLVVVGTRSK